MAISVFLLGSVHPLSATITPTTQIQDIIPVIEENSLVLFNIAEVLMDTDRSLGTSAWRRYIRKKVDAKKHDILTLYVAKHVPAKVPDAAIPVLIQQLQDQGYPVLAFTSRGRSEWYSSNIQGVDVLTEFLLYEIGIHLEKTQLPKELGALETTFADYYHAGILYATNGVEKGEFLKRILTETGYRPAKIVFIDDKADSLQTVDAAMKEMGISFEGFAYNKTAQDHKNFDPMIANIQLEWLVFNNKLLTDAEATQIKAEQFNGVDADQYFDKLMERCNFNALLDASKLVF